MSHFILLGGGGGGGAAVFCGAHLITVIQLKEWFQLDDFIMHVGGGGGGGEQSPLVLTLL